MLLVGSSFALLPVDYDTNLPAIFTYPSREGAVSTVWRRGSSILLGKNATQPCDCVPTPPYRDINGESSSETRLLAST